MIKMRGFGKIKPVLIFAVISAMCLYFPSSVSAYIDEADSPANIVIGQANMTSGLKNQTGNNEDTAANSFNSQFQMMSDGTKLFVADYWNNRVLIYNSIPTSNDASADVVVGQPNMTSNGKNQDPGEGDGTVAANTLFQPTGVFSDGTKLYICDYLNSRILIYNTIPTENDASANVVVGQANMTSGDKDRGVGQPTAAANGLDWPRSVHTDGTKLYVIDTGNHRALIYNTIPAADGASADVVVGQPNMTSYGQNQGGGVGGVAANTLSQPADIFSDGTKLYIADYNNRVLIYNTIPTSDDTSANVVVGQADMTSNGTNQDPGEGGGTIGANTLGLPNNVFTDDTRLFVSDLLNNRILIYNSVPTTNDASADAVIGQQNMTSGTANQGGSISSSTIKTPRGVFLSGTKLIITDSGNHRSLIYDVSPGITESETPGVGPISINSAAASATSHSITLTLNAGGAKEMMISNNSDLSGASWETYSTTKSWTLSSGNSIKTVYLKFRDYANFESTTYSDDIDLLSSSSYSGVSDTDSPDEDADDGDVATELPYTGGPSTNPYIIFIFLGVILSGVFGLFCLKKYS